MLHETENHDNFSPNSACSQTHTNTHTVSKHGNSMEHTETDISGKHFTADGHWSRLKGQFIAAIGMFATEMRHGSLLTFWRFTNQIIIIIIIII